MTTAPLIEVEDLRIDLEDGPRRVAAAEGVSFRIDRFCKNTRPCWSNTRI